ncbi:MAG: Cof-type HAD-IIB family hydrolase [Actinomycetota bacterium]
MPTPAPRLLASDLDGTLLGLDSQVSPVTVDALKRARAAGIEVVAATGRSHWSALPRILPTESIRWLIGSNGATLFDVEKGAVVQRRLIPVDHIVETVSAVTAEFPEVGISWETPEGVHHTEQWERNRAALGRPIPLEYQGRRRPFDPHAEQLVKLMLAHDRLSTYEWLDALTPVVPHGLSASTSGAAFVEVTRADANKGQAVADLCATLGIDQADTIAFGDHSNDLSMLRWVGTGYAMAGADDLVKGAADAVAPPHHEHGVAQVIDALLGV